MKLAGRSATGRPSGLIRGLHATLTLQMELEPLGIRVTTVRAGQMKEKRSVWNGSPKAGARFLAACQEIGFDTRKRSSTHFRSAAELLHFILDLPSDLQVTGCPFGGWK